MTTWPHQDDRIAVRAFLIGTALVTVLTVLYVLAAWGIDRFERQHLRVRAGHPHVPDQVNAMDMTLYEEPTLAEEERVIASRRLHSVGWVDRESGIVHIPIQRAMQVYLRGLGRGERP